MTLGLKDNKVVRTIPVSSSSRDRTANQPRFFFTVAGTDMLVVDFTASERVSAPFLVELTLAAEDEIQFEDVIGQSGRLRLDSVDADRYFHGIVSQFIQTGIRGRFFMYKAHLAPQIWLLSLERDCRIFQQKSVPQIVQTILEDSGITSDTFEFRLQGTYAERDYCVQYRESDLNFISRLLEEEGIFYFFEHQEEDHKLVFGDGTVNYQPIAGNAEVPYNPGGSMVSDGEAVYRFLRSRSVCTGRYTLRDFDYAKPRLNLTTEQVDKENKAYERYDYPGEYLTEKEGKHLAQVRLQEAVMYKEKTEGDSICPRFAPGFTFDLFGHDMSSFDQTYLLHQVNHTGSQPQVLQERSADGGGTSYSNLFYAIPASVTLRPELKARKPVVEGVQTAIVTGPANEEIYTDKHGRVKVQFHWDRLGKKDNESSCWIRVSQVAAGAGWGAMDVPRIGHEVIVDFVEGDPDRPIITGRVYNGDNTPPFDLPDKRMVHGMKSNTTPGGKGFNEISLDDTKDGEVITIHAQKDMNAKIENNHSTSVGADQTISVGGKRTISVGKDQSTTIKHNRSATLENGNDKLDVKAGSRTVSIKGGSHTVTVDGGNVSATASDAVVITGKGKGVAVTGKGKGVAVSGTGGDGVTITGAPGFAASGKEKAKISSPVVDIGNDDIKIHGSKIHLSAGGSTITMDSSGITIGGAAISAAGRMKVTISVGINSAEYSPQGVTTSGSKITSSAIGVHQLSGALIKIN